MARGAGPAVAALGEPAGAGAVEDAGRGAARGEGLVVEGTDAEVRGTTGPLHRGQTVAFGCSICPQRVQKRGTMARDVPASG